MSEVESSSQYLHGYTDEERQRLHRQAAFIAPHIFPSIDFKRCRRILEIGSGVGAQTEHLLKIFPEIHVTCIDLNEAQLHRAAQTLAQLPIAEGRYELIKQDAHSLAFPAESFDGVFICWVLEHLPDPGQVLREAKRVLRSGGSLYANEVMNASLFLHPHCPDTWTYWQAYNLFQKTHGGDPNVGPKLGALLHEAGFEHINVAPKWLHADRRNPSERQKALSYWCELLLSGKNQLLEAMLIYPSLVDQVTAEFRDLAESPEAVVYYSFIQAKAQKPMASSFAK